jgi:hypothetical protein
MHETESNLVNEFRLGLRLPSLAWIPKPLTSFWKVSFKAL